MPKERSYDQMKGTLGSLLLLWSSIETALRVELERAGKDEIPAKARGANALLAAWEQLILNDERQPALAVRLASQLKSQAQDPLRVRNGICHGLRGVTAARGETAGSITWDNGGQAESCTWDELQQMFAWLSKLPAAIGMISDAAVSKGREGSSRALPDAEWWAAEYGIDVRPEQDQMLRQ